MSQIETPHTLSNLKTKNWTLIKIVSFAALLHSQVFWFYSIVYIVFCKVSPEDKKPRRLRLRGESVTQHVQTITPKVTTKPSTKPSLRRIIPLIRSFASRIQQKMKGNMSKIKNEKKRSIGRKRERAISMIKSTIANFHKKA
ncbi:unnamed protein product [Rhizopus stolonifer]